MRAMLAYDIWLARVREDNPDFDEAYQELSRFDPDEPEDDEDEC